MNLILLVRRILAKKRIARLPSLRVASQYNFWKSLTSPSPDVTLTILTSEGASAGIARYAVSPLNDRVYVYGIDVEPALRRSGYGLAMLWHISRLHALPIVPVRELHSASEFWRAARRLGPAGLFVAPSISIGEIELHREQWAHLKPQADLLERQIDERIARREDWYSAVGRGLD